MHLAPKDQGTPPPETNPAGRADDPVPLFRPKALEPRQAQHGRAAPLTPPSWKWVTIGIALIVATIIAGLAFANFSRKETVVGRLRPAGGEFRMIAPRSGVVRKVLVADGAWVRRGQPLLTVSTETVLNAGGSTNQRLMEGIGDERQAMRSRLGNVGAAFASQERESRLLQASLRAQADMLAQQSRLLQERLDLATKYLQAGKTLEAKGFITFSEIKRREEAVIALQQQRLQQDSERAQLLSQAAQAGAAATRAAAEAEAQENSLRESLAALSQKEVEAELQEGFVLRAPLSGRVTGLRAVAGKAVDTVQPLLTILATPDAAEQGGGSGLVADLFVPTRAIGFIEPKQKVRLLIDAFPYTKYGPVSGTILSVSETALAPEELEQVEGDPKEPVYVATVTLDKESLEAFAAARSMKAGMTLTADIILEERSLAEWLFEPLFATRHRM